MPLFKRQKSEKDTLDLKIEKKIPLLTLDARWHELFPKSKKTRRMIDLEKKLNEYIKEQGQINNEFREYTSLKKKMMKEIMENMEDVFDKNDEDATKHMEKNKKFINDINEKLKKYEEMLDDLPNKIKEANDALLKISVDICYNDMEDNNQAIHSLEQWIKDTKEELKNNIVIKEEKEIENQKIYTYMHDLLGYEMINKFDQNYGDKSD
ncbi:hypothetical protein [Natranaerovirga hydrolytica]|nr:hypothetical protein [Natranaerovirga hydrolytica]